MLDQSIGLDAYRALLSRLLGFHLSFERAARSAPSRSCWLKADLRALGAEDQQIAAISLCPGIPSLAASPRLLGALYVVEGSTLGGRVLAARLDRLLGRGVTEGRRFFLGHEGESGAAWRRFLAQLETAAETEAARREVIAAAVETFGAFESWLVGWEGNGHVPA